MAKIPSKLQPAIKLYEQLVRNTKRGDGEAGLLRNKGNEKTLFQGQWFHAKTPRKRQVYKNKWLCDFANFAALRGSIFHAKTAKKAQSDLFLTATANKN
jgi:hypothetical protein